jgi:hypothetical protein
MATVIYKGKPPEQRIRDREKNSGGDLRADRSHKARRRCSAMLGEPIPTSTTVADCTIPRQRYPTINKAASEIRASEMADQQDPRRYRSTEELAFANIGGGMPAGLPADTVDGRRVIRTQLPRAQREALDRQIDDCMRGAIADALHRPNPVTGGPRSPTVRPADAAPVRTGGNGWRDTGPLAPVATPLAEAVIAAMTHQALPMGQGNSEFKGKKEEK